MVAPMLSRMRISLAIFVCLAACSGSSADDACTKLADAMCAKIGACIVGGTTLRYPDDMTCIARQKAGCLAALSAKDTANTPAQVQSCAAAVDAVACSDYEAADFTGCAPLAGSRANGSPCAYPAQCQSAFCAIARGTNCGVCAPPSQAGDSCATQSCSRGFTCIADNQQCQSPVASGGTCDKDHPCGYALSCVTPMAASSGSCMQAGTAGATCDPRKQTAPGCDADAALSCDGMTKTCAATSYAGAGSACGDVANTAVACNAASVCFGAMGMTPGICKALALEGQPCDFAAGPTCMAPARCVTGSATVTSGTCQLPDPGACG